MLQKGVFLHSRRKLLVRENFYHTGESDENPSLVLGLSL